MSKEGENLHQNCLQSFPNDMDFELFSDEYSDHQKHLKCQSVSTEMDSAPSFSDLKVNHTL